MATDRGTRAALGAGRVVGAALLVLMAAVHLLLWFQGYSAIPVIGPAFLANVAGGVVLALAVLLVPRRLLAAAATLGALFTAGTLAALVVSMTVGLFGVVERLATPFVPTSLVCESAGVLVLAVTAGLAARSADPQGHAGAWSREHLRARRAARAGRRGRDGPARDADRTAAR